MKKVVVSVALVSSTSLGAAWAQSTPKPKAEEGYSLSVFASGVTGKYTKPDSVAVSGPNVFVGYGDGNLPDGSDGKNTQVVQYDLNGSVDYIYSVPGHNDGLKVDPSTHKLWSLQNEDASPNLYIIDPSSHSKTAYTFLAPPPNGGGYDDIVFRDGKVYFSASNPANNPNNGPAIVEVRLEGHTIAVKPVLEGNAQATNVVTGATVALNLQDPDSMTLDASGDLFLTSQADGELVVVRKPGAANQSVLLIPLSSPYGTPMVDDSVFTKASAGFILIADKDANKVYALHRAGFTGGAAYSAAQGMSGGATVGFVGRLDQEFGLLTPVVTGLLNPGGLAFVSTGGDGDDDKDDKACKASD